jgi:flavin reductase (DIM6/NTAB) family NADH-FMN oxidoreductase RutF
MHYRPEVGHGLPFDPFKSCTIPRPIGWLSTRSADGVDNLAPFSQWQNLTWEPPMVMFAANQSVLGGQKDTVRNTEETGWFVWNMATWDLREAVNKSSVAVPPEVDEFDFVGVTKASCVEAPVSRVAESPCHFECRYVQTVRIPAASRVATVDLVIGEVALVHLDDEVITSEGKLDVLKMKPIARLGYFDYTVIDQVFEMVPPGATEAELAGLEGKALPTTIAPATNLPS